MTLATALLLIVGAILVCVGAGALAGFRLTRRIVHQRLSEDTMQRIRLDLARAVSAQKSDKP